MPRVRTRRAARRTRAEAPLRRVCAGCSTTRFSVRVMVRSARCACRRPEEERPQAAQGTMAAPVVAAATARRIAMAEAAGIVRAGIVAAAAPGTKAALRRGGTATTATHGGNRRHTGASHPGEAAAAVILVTAAAAGILVTAAAAAAATRTVRRRLSATRRQTAVTPTGAATLSGVATVSLRAEGTAASRPGAAAAAAFLATAAAATVAGRPEPAETTAAPPLVLATRAGVPRAAHASAVASAWAEAVTAGHQAAEDVTRHERPTREEPESFREEFMSLSVPQDCALTTHPTQNSCSKIHVIFFNQLCFRGCDRLAHISHSSIEPFSHPRFSSSRYVSVKRVSQTRPAVECETKIVLSFAICAKFSRAAKTAKCLFSTKRVCLY